MVSFVELPEGYSRVAVPHCSSAGYWNSEVLGVETCLLRDLARVAQRQVDDDSDSEAVVRYVGSRPVALLSTPSSEHSTTKVGCIDRFAAVGIETCSPSVPVDIVDQTIARLVMSSDQSSQTPAVTRPEAFVGHRRMEVHVGIRQDECHGGSRCVLLDRCPHLDGYSHLDDMATDDPVDGTSRVSNVLCCDVRCPRICRLVVRLVRRRSC